MQVPAGTGSGEIGRFDSSNTIADDVKMALAAKQVCYIDAAAVAGTAIVYRIPCIL
jgi:hypothetical protein